jgi:hypothetical protein
VRDGEREGERGGEREPQTIKYKPMRRFRVRGKVHPRPGQKGPEGEKMYRATFSLTSVLDGGGWSTSRLGRFNPVKDSVSIV